MAAQASADAAEFYDAIERFDVEAWATSRGAEHTAKAHELLLVCPDCQKLKLCINAAKKNYHCWFCHRDGRGGGLIDLIAMIDQTPRAQVVQYILAEAQKRPVGALRPLTTAAPSTEVRWALPIDWPRGWSRIDARRYAELPYLARRGIGYADVLVYGLVWCSYGRLRGRLVFPVFERGRLVYWQARAMWEAADAAPGERFIKAINPSKAEVGTGKDEVLFNLDQARQHPRVAVVEGPIDAVRAGPSSVCTFGHAISHIQIAKLRQAGVRAIDLMWDGPTENEPAGAMPQMIAAAPLLSELFDLRLVVLPRGDPGSMERHEIEQARAQAQPYRRS